MNEPSLTYGSQLNVPPPKPGNPLLRKVIEAGQTAPAKALALARTAFSTLSPSSASDYRAHVALALGVALNRAERYAEAVTTLTDLQPVLENLNLTSELALCHWQIGIAARFLREDTHFVEKLEKALADLLSAGLEIEAARCRRDLAAAYNWKGNYEASAAQIAQARSYFEQQGLRADAAQCAFAESARLRWTGQFAEAIKTLKEAETVFSTDDWPVERAATWLYEGSVYAASMDFEKAIPYLQQAREEFEKLDLPARLASCQVELGLTAIFQGRLRDAESALHFATQSFQSLAMRGDLAVAALNLANIHYYQGEMVEARALYQQSQAEFRAIGNRLYEALCELDIGATESELGRYGSALHHLERARVSFADIGSAAYVALAHHNLGKTWHELNDLELAIHHLTLAHRTCREIGSFFPAARSLVHLALVRAHQGKILEAQRNLQEARRTCEEAGAAGYMAVCDQVSGEIYAYSGQHAEASPLLASAENAFDSLGMPLNTLACRIGRAASYLALGEHESAEPIFRQAFMSAEKSLPDLAWRCAAGLAQIAEGRNQVEEALGWHQRVISSIKNIHHSLQHEMLVNTFLTGRAQAIDRAIAAVASFSQADAALGCVEDSRARLLAAHLSRFPALPDVNSSQRALRLELTELRRRLSISFDSGNSFIRPPGAKQQNLLDDLDRKGREYQQLTAMTGNAASNEGAPLLSFDLTRLRRQLSDVAPAGWTCLLYHWLRDELLIFVIGEEAIELRRLRLGPMDELALDLCTSPQPDRRRLMYGAGHGSSGFAHLKRLREVLLPVSLRERLTPEHLLMILPAGRLHNLPFQALTDGQVYLCQQATVAYASSLTSLGFCLDHIGEVAPRPTSALIVAIEEFGEIAPHLPHAGYEADIVGQFLQKPTLLRNTAATPEAVAQLLQSEHSIIHFATHAVFDAQIGRLSRILLHNGDLQADEVEQLTLKTRLVALPACQTALGQRYQGEELIGLTQAFLVAGAPSVLSALWAMDDRVSPSLMNGFYERLFQRQFAPAHALAETQREWINNGRSILDWAALTLYGAP